MIISSLVIFGILGIVGLMAIFGAFFLVDQQSVRFVETFGKFSRVAHAGFNFKIPFIQSASRGFSLKVNQLDIDVDTKTKDNVFVNVHVAFQFLVKKGSEFEAYYLLENPKSQIVSYVYDVVRAQVPTMNLDEVFEKKDAISDIVQSTLQEKLNQYGFAVEKALVTDIAPDEKVKEAMNEINASQRLAVAATAKGEAEKIAIVKKAEAEAESKKLQGEGIANQRMAIAEGLKKSAAMLKEAGLEDSQVMPTILLTQYFDTMKDMSAGSKVVFLPSSPSGVAQFSNEIRTAIMSTD